MPPEGALQQNLYDKMRGTANKRLDPKLVMYAKKPPAEKTHEDIIAMLERIINQETMDANRAASSQAVSENAW